MLIEQLEFVVVPEDLLLGRRTFRSKGGKQESGTRDVEATSAVSIQLHEMPAASQTGDCRANNRPRQPSTWRKPANSA